MDHFDHRGFIGVLSSPINEALIQGLVGLWLEKFERVEQVIPNIKEGATRVIESLEDIIPENNSTFRISQGEDFAWAYLTQDLRVIETTSFPGEGEIPAMCLSILVGLPSLIEIIDENDEDRLNELEAQGIL